jgi:predicted acyltransferase
MLMKDNPIAQEVPNLALKAGERYMAVDALRGFDMFWILGGESVIHALKKISHSPIAQTLARQLSHVDWDGFAFYDLIFPLFVFLVGVSLVFSLGRIIEREGKPAAYKRLFRRFILLYLLGIFYYHGMANTWPNIRMVGVLQRLALCYFFAGLIFCNFRPRGMVAICAGLLIGYWALMAFVPVPGLGVGHFEPGHNLANWIDEHYLPGRKWDKTWDPEGLLSTLPAIGTCLIGVFVGQLLKVRSLTALSKVGCLIGAGTVGVVLGYLWGHNFPVVKKIWTSSFVLVAGGYSCILLGVFMFILDVCQLKRWAQPFVWIGLNPLALYMAANMLDFEDIAERFVGGNIKAAIDPYGTMLICAVSLGFVFLLAYYLQRKKIFLRL